MQIKLFILFIVFTFFQFGFIDVVFGAPGGQRPLSPPRPTRPAGMQDHYSSGSHGSSSHNPYVSVSPNNHGSRASSPVRSGANSPPRQGSQPVYSDGRPITAQNVARGQRNEQLVHTAVGAGAVAYGAGSTAVGAGRIVKGIVTGDKAKRHDGYAMAASGVIAGCTGAVVCLMQGGRAINNHVRAHSSQAATARYQDKVNADTKLATHAAQHHQ